MLALHAKMDVNNEKIVSVEQLENACRVCLLTDRDNHNIFQGVVSDFESEIKDAFTLLQKLQHYGGIEISMMDGLPDKICTFCIAKISVAHDFRDQCQRADEKLRQLYGKPLTGQPTISRKTQHQYCQTDVSLMLRNTGSANDFMTLTKTDSTTCTNNLPHISGIDDTRFRENFQSSGIGDVEFGNAVSGICKEPFKMDIEKKCSTRQARRSNRVSIFKRMTSIENLKSHKEKQRQYIKKSTNSRIDSKEADSSTGKQCWVKSRKTMTRVELDQFHRCNECNRSYSTKKSLARHMLMHVDKKLECKKCGKQFYRLDKFMEHSKLHAKLNVISCNICDKTFRKTETMVRHLNIHKKANPVEVFTILKEIRERRKLENQMESSKVAVGLNGHQKHEIRISDSRNVNDLMENQLTGANEEESQLRSPHTKSNSDIVTFSCKSTESYNCEKCQKRCSTKKALQRHIVIHEEKKYLCNVCNMKFFKAARLKSHREQYGHTEDDCSLQKPPNDKLAIKLINSWIKEELDSDNEGKGFPCETCGKSYATKKSLQKHKSNIHKSNEHTCTDECKCARKLREDSETNTRNVKPFNCDECNKSFEKQCKLEKHLRIHERAKEQQDTNFKRFLCHICSKTFRQNTGLMFHMRTHTGYKPHVCKYCGRGFTSNSNCINHERTHTGDRPFVCHFCSAAFAKSCTLKAHITTHTGEANYHCKTCGKSFRRLKYLKEHRFTHTGEKPYACKICGTAYSHSGSLFVHEKKCKAQYNTYQNVPSQPYPEPQITVNTPLVMTPIIPTLTSSHYFNGTSQPLGTHANKSYVESMHRMSAHAAAVANPVLHMHSNSEISDMASAVRSFAVIGQIFHS